MKSKHIAKILAVVMVVVMLPLWTLGCGNKLAGHTFSALGEQLIGSGKLSVDDASSKVYLSALDEEVKTLNSHFQPAGSWLAERVKDGDSAATAHYKYLYKMALAWATKGSEFYHSGDILDKIKVGLEYGYTSVFGDNQLVVNRGTLYDRQSCAINLLRIVMLLDGKLKGADVEKWLSIIEIKFPAPLGEGLDRLRTTYICIAYNAYVGNTENVEKFATTFLEDVITVVNTGDGLHADGSYIWDFNTVNTLEGGVEAASLLADLTYALADTDCALGTPATDALYNWVVSSMKYALYNGNAMSSALGVSFTKGEYMGGQAIATMLKIAELCNEEQALAIKSLVKAYGTNGDGRFATGLGTYGAELYLKVMESKKIEASTEIIGAHSYAEADTLSVLGKEFSLSIAMSSLRTNKYESKQNIAEEDVPDAHNGNLWFVRDGMFTPYSSDYKLPNSYWANVNAMRIPGTTVDNRQRKKIYTDAYNGITNYAGSAVLGSTAVSAMIATGNNAEYMSDLSAKKAWFVFEDKIVFLGTEINNSTLPKQIPSTHKQNIETVIENIYYGSFNAVYTAFEDGDMTLSNAEKVLEPGTCMFVSRYGGIYIPASNLDVVKTKLNTNDGGNFVEIWIEHGPEPEDASYEYAIYPSTAVNMRSFYTMQEEGDMGYTVLSNTGEVQAVKDTKNNYVGYTFWNAASCNGITTDFACTIMVKESDSQITVAIADFSHNAPDNNGGTITLTGSFSQVKADAGLTFSGNTITVDRAAVADGQTLTIVLSK